MNRGIEKELIKFAVGVVQFALGALFVMLLWDLIIPDLTGASEIGYVDSLVLMVLGEIVAGNWGKPDWEKK